MADHPLSYWLSDTNDTGRLWRSILLFGKNTATYKFALGGALIEVTQTGSERITLEELAVPFSRRICEHLKIEDRQAVSASSQFIEACRRFNTQDIDLDELVSVTVAKGFNNVLDAFHVVGGEDVPSRFFTVEGLTKNRVLHPDDQLLRIETSKSAVLEGEVEARWRLVETAWSMGISSSLLDVHMDRATEQLIVRSDARVRKNIGGAKWAFNGYQDGKCFYCNIELDAPDVSSTKTHVDHVIPFRLNTHFVDVDLDHVWNLVNACSECNLAKHDKMPGASAVERVYQRNEYYIQSNHPLKDAIIRATGGNSPKRAEMVKHTFAKASELMPTKWSPR
jgi:5-methylcytosine-specific restriction endonuclease McrA